MSLLLMKVTPRQVRRQKEKSELARCGAGAPGEQRVMLYSTRRIFTALFACNAAGRRIRFDAVPLAPRYTYGADEKIEMLMVG